MDAFWMVWSPQGFPPVFRHSTLASAQEEAARLLRESPNREFFVLEAVSLARFKPKEDPIEHMRLDSTPF